MNYKGKKTSVRSTVATILAFVGFMGTLGGVGAIERETIDLTHGFAFCAVCLAVMLLGVWLDK